MAIAPESCAQIHIVCGVSIGLLLITVLVFAVLLGKSQKAQKAQKAQKNCKCDGNDNNEKVKG